MPAGAIDAIRCDEGTWQMLSWIGAETREGFDFGWDKRSHDPANDFVRRQSETPQQRWRRLTSPQAIERSQSVPGVIGSDAGRSPGAVGRRELREFYPRGLALLIGNAKCGADRDGNRDLGQKEAEARHEA